MSDFRRAFDIAKQAHKGQTDKAGRDYFHHPLHIAMQFKGDEKRMIIGILHDVIEDSDVTIEDLRRDGFAEDILAALVALTKQEGETYHDALCRVAANDLALPVKIADMRHNSDLSRLGRAPTDKDIARQKKYHHYIAQLLIRSKKGKAYKLQPL